MDQLLSSQGKLSMHEFVHKLLGLSKVTLDQQRSIKFHFFEQEYTFSCFEYQALFVADEFYKTRYAVRLEHGMESLNLSKKFFKNVCSQLINRYEVCIWGKKTSDINAPYELLAQGCPGNIRAVEDALGGFVEHNIVGDYVASLYLEQSLDCSYSFSMAYFNDSDYHLSVFYFKDDADFSQLRSIFSQYSIRDCLLLDNSKSDVDNLVENIDNDNRIGNDKDENSSVIWRVKSILEIDLNVFVDTMAMKEINSDRDKHSVISEIVDILHPSGFAYTSSSVNIQDSDKHIDTEVYRVQRLREIDEAFRGNSSALMVSLVTLRRQQRIEHIRHKDTSENFQIPISFSVNLDGNINNHILLLDQTTISSLSLVPNEGISSQAALSKRSVQQSSLFRLLDRTCTTMGRRLLRNWIQRPSAHLPTILARQESISFFMQNSRKLASIRESSEQMKNFPDLEKLLQRLRPFPSIQNISSTGNRELRDILELYKCILRAAAICDTLDVTADPPSSSRTDTLLTTSYVQELQEIIGKCKPLLQLVEEILDAEHLQASYSRASSGMKSGREGDALFRARFLRIKPNLCPELETAHQQLEDVTKDILAYVATLPTTVAIDAKELHLERSAVHGIHLRVTKRISSKVLKSLDSQKITYRVVSQQKAGVLFLTKPLETLLQKYSHRKELFESQQVCIVLEAMKVARTYVGLLQSMVDKLATLDVLMSLACVSLTYDWTIPTLFEPTGDDGDMLIELNGMYHPLLRERLGASQVVSSNLCLQAPCLSRNIFGPNMGGKSTFLKAMGTIMVLAQMGSAVPAMKARLPILERLFLRTGAAESAALGMSSFLAEMNAMSELLRLASPRSLILIDEIGRGTSTSDGFGLAWAILEELVLQKKSIVLCATHFHELSQLENVQNEANLPVFGSLHVNAIVDEQTKEIRMLYKVLPGSNDDSYGVHCAKIAGFPDDIVENAFAIEKMLDNQKKTVQISSTTELTRSIAEDDNKNSFRKRSLCLETHDESMHGDEPSKKISRR